tara:strand:+ start:3836 stop:4231 length:396 start_codon:yes stop_codon:yes gene_type:complete
MNNVLKKYFTMIIVLLSFISFLYTSNVQANDLALKGAKDSVGKRFASKFCEAKEERFSLESSSEFALNNTYLKFVALPDDEKYIEDLWDFTIGIIRKDCGDYLTKNEENNLRDFFIEEGKIASNRDLYLPN